MLETILSVLQNILTFFSSAFDRVANLLDKIGDSIFNINILLVSDLLPSFLVGSIMVVSSMHVIKLILSMGSYHE